MKTNAKQVFDRINKKVYRVVKDAPRAMANEGVKVFLENFKTESWNNNPWEKRKRSKSSRPLLIGKTRRLRNSVVNSVRSARYDRIIWASYLPYAAVHNYGEQVTRLVHMRTGTIKAKVRGNSGFINGKFTKGRSRTVKLQGERKLVSGSYFKMPKRQFMGDSVKLRKRLKEKFEKVFRANFK